MIDPPLRRGDFVHVTYPGGSIEAVVTLASENGRSLMLMFDGMIGGWVSMMPALQSEVNGTWTSLDGMTLVLRRLPDGSGVDE